MEIRILAIGKNKETWLKQGFELYLKRLAHYARVELIELQAKNYSDSRSQMKAEAELIRSKVSGKLILIDVEGKMLSSETLAKKVESWQMQSATKWTLVLGGAFGFEPALKKEAEERISLSAMTLPHMLARLVLLEQLYRAFSINKNEPYHK
jgi:23S rRNA (pseudouridine1915-N3)-methyltransferase